MENYEYKVILIVILIFVAFSLNNFATDTLKTMMVSAAGSTFGLLLISIFDIDLFNVFNKKPNKITVNISNPKIIKKLDTP